MAIVVKRRKGDSNNDVVREFKKRTIRDQIVPRIRERRFYKKPSTVKKEKRKQIEHERELAKKRREDDYK